MSAHLAISQIDSTRLSLAFENASIKDVLNDIETKIPHRFYYEQSWLGTKTISGTYTNALISDILNELFNNTVINFYILKDNRIALIQNNIIYDELPEGFFGKTENSIEDIEPTDTPERTPVFYVGENTPNKMRIETVRIGRAQDGAKQPFTLRGFVRQITTGEPIPNLSLVVKNTNIGTVTDDSGYYELELNAGLNSIETSSLGIESVQINVIIYNNGELNFDLNESFEQLAEVVVEADAAKNVEEAISGATEIESEETKNVPVVLGERNILKVATTLPGISTAGEGATGFNVRGGNADQNLVILDDAVIYNPSHFFGIFQALNPYTTQGVKIYKGSIPAEFGGRLSSVFDITTKDANTKEFAGEASVGPVTNNIALEIPISKGKSALILGGRSSYSDWILKSLDEKSLRNSKASFYDLIAKYNHKINEYNDIRATAYYSRDAFSITSDSLYNYSNRVFSLKWDHKFNEKNSGALLFADSEYRFNIDFDGDSNTDFHFGYKIHESEIKLKMKYLYSDRHNFDYGLSTKLYSVNPGSIRPDGSASILEAVNIPEERALESALFISDNFKVSENFLIDFGIRYSLFFALGESVQNIYQEGLPKSENTQVDTKQFDTNEIIETYSAPEFRLSGRYSFTPTFSIKGGYNTSYQYIHTLSNNTTVSPIDTWKLSDLNIKPQRAIQYSLGLFKNLEENNYEISLEGYYKRSKNNLDFKVGADLLLNENIETEVLQGIGKSYGIEFLIRKNRGKINGWLGYTYSRSFLKMESTFSEEQVNGGDYFPSNFDKPHDFSLVTNYKFTKRFSLSTNFIYQTGRPVTFPIGSYIFNGAEFAFYSDRNKFRIPDYYRLDLSFNVEGNHKLKKIAHSFWNISIYNVLGRNNPYSVFFVTEDGKLQAYKSSIFSIPIPTITYNFKF